MKQIKNKSELKLKTEPRVQQEIVLSLAMQEAIAVLGMPLPELAQWLQTQIEQNPALQFSEETESLDDFEILDEVGLSFPKTFLSDFSDRVEQVSAPPLSLYEYLRSQAQEVLSSPQELISMENLIGNLDEKGFINDPTADPALVQLLQSFDPPGIGARDLRHCLLLQLYRRGDQHSLAYRLIEEHYEDLFQETKEKLCQKLSCTMKELETALYTTLASLSFNPAAAFQQDIIPLQIPDIFIEASEVGWIITLNDSLLPSFQLNLSSELRHFEASAQWVKKMLSRRHLIITRITEIVLEVQANFFHGKTSDLEPLSFKQVAQKLSLHESTISRAVKEKYLSCPRGIFPLRYFFSPSASCSNISQHTAKERLKELIHRESKQKPFSDEELKAALHAQGISCARRTVTKYRQSLKIPPASQRKELD